jgi:hypothetical protein
LSNGAAAVIVSTVLALPGWLWLIDPAGFRAIQNAIHALAAIAAGRVRR